ncbi:MAG: hypothetical protein GY696_32235 [Gammaproteobacteria bacterium]|nr:hypothetical protein [Gammaproteobacteria bacterium]
MGGRKLYSALRETRGREKSGNGPLGMEEIFLKMFNFPFRNPGVPPLLSEDGKDLGGNRQVFQVPSPSHFQLAPGLYKEEHHGEEEILNCLK